MFLLDSFSSVSILSLKHFIAKLCLVSCFCNLLKYSTVEVTKPVPQEDAGIQDLIYELQAFSSSNKGNAIPELDATAGHGDPSRLKLGSSFSLASVLLHDRSCAGVSDVPEAKAFAPKSD